MSRQDLNMAESRIQFYTLCGSKAKLNAAVIEGTEPLRARGLETKKL